MDIDLTIKNYRCFPDMKPVRVVIRKGFTSFVGVNSSGKSSLLRFFYELRSAFQLLADSTQLGVSLSQPYPFNLPASVYDSQNDIFFNGNDHDLEVELRVLLARGEIYRNPALAPNLIKVTIPRGTNTFLSKVFLADVPLKVPTNQLSAYNAFLEFGGKIHADVKEFCDAFGVLADTLYIGAFRNALNMGAMDNYFDINIGESFIRQWDSYKTGASKRHNDSAFQVQTDIRRIFEFLDLEINAAPDNKALQVRVD
jgi:hypothetical protein